MAGAFQKTLPRLAGNIIPGLLTIFLILVARVPLQDTDAGMFVPLFSLTFTYFFRLHFPRSGRLWFIFILGLLEDFLSGGFLGLTSLVLLLVAALFERQRRIFLQGTFLTEIVIFTFFSLGFSILYWAIASIAELQVLRILPFIIQGAVTALAYPVYVFLIVRVSKRFSI